MQKTAPSLEGGGCCAPYKLLESKMFKSPHDSAEKQFLASKWWMLQTLSAVRNKDIQEPPSLCRKALLALKGVDVANLFSC
eukprot:4740794-Karenia_brevis.AAC.1